METSPWYDPEQLDKYFDKFHEGEAFEYNSDEFSLPDVGAGDQEEDSFPPDEQGEVSVISEAKRDAAANSSILSGGNSGVTPEKRLSVDSAKALSEPRSATPEEKAVKVTTPEEAKPKALKSHASSSGGSQSRRHIAGFSTVGKHVNAADSPAIGVDVRQKNYKKLKQKAPSEISLYEFVAMDVLRGKKKVSKVYSQVALPWMSEERKGTSGLPHVLVINFQLPNKGPQMFRSSSDTDPGTSLVLYFRLRPIKPDDVSLKLAHRFFTGNAPGRFKTIAFVDNMSELRFPSMLASTFNKFNGQPIIIHKTGVFFNDRDVSEVDIDVFQFPVVARTALASGRATAERARLRIAFVLQGETEDELPERLLGCCEIRHLDLDGAYDRFN